MIQAASWDPGHGIADVRSPSGDPGADAQNQARSSWPPVLPHPSRGLGGCGACSPAGLQQRRETLRLRLRRGACFARPGVVLGRRCGVRRLGAGGAQLNARAKIHAGITPRP